MPPWPPLHYVLSDGGAESFLPILDGFPGKHAPGARFT
jgi:hypothetical protein